METERVSLVAYTSFALEQLEMFRMLTRLLVCTCSAVLNLPVFATEADIREKHRQLSLIFHPDKQRDERTKEVAHEKFLEVQKAYESTCADL